MSITFFVGYIFVLLLTGSELILRHFETQPQIISFFDLQATQDQVSQTAEILRSKPYVKEVNVVSKEEALEVYQEDNKKDPLLLELVTAEILPASIEVSAYDITSLNDIEKDLINAPGISEVLYQRDVVESFAKWTRSIRIVGIGAITILSFTSILIIIVITGMKVSAKRSAIKIMRLIGATKWYIKSPFILEGAWYGALGSVVGWALSYTLLLYATPWLLDFLGDIKLLPVPPAFMAMLLGGGTCIGIIFGAFASLIAVQRLLRR